MSIITTQRAGHAPAITAGPPARAAGHPAAEAYPAAYHRFWRSKPQWWRPVVEIAVLLAVFLALQVIWAFLPINLSDMSTRDMYEGASRRPEVNLFTFGFIALGVPAVLIAALAAGKPLGALFSVEYRLRWRLLAKALVCIALPVALILAVELAVFGLQHPADARFWWNILILVTLVPLQCLAEELAYRGVLPQALGMWVRSPWLAYGLPLPLFVAMHEYDVVGLSVVAFFAVFASVLVHRTGGLEAAIVLHTTMNATVAFRTFTGAIEYDGAQLALGLLCPLAMYTGAVVFLVRTRPAGPLPGVFVASLPHPTGELLGPGGVEIYGPGGALTRLPWFGDFRHARTTVDGLEFTYRVAPGCLSLTCRNIGPARPVTMAIIGHFRASGFQWRGKELLLIDAHRTLTIRPRGENNAVAYPAAPVPAPYPAAPVPGAQPGLPRPGVIAGPALENVLLAPGQHATLELQFSVVSPR